VQGEKVRPIDDFSEFDVNRSFGARHKLRMNSVETVVALARAWSESVDGSGKFCLEDATGEKWRGSLHAEWTPVTWRKLVGRLTDLKSAYKQLASHPANAFVSLVAVRTSQNEVKLFRAFALMFGATAAVYAFLRFSRAIARLALKLLSILVVEFFDDFSQLEVEATAESGRETFLELLSLLGWRVADSAAKSKPFAECFVTLGAEVDLALLSAEGAVRVGNKPGRATKIAAVIRAAVDRPLGLKDALSIRGLLVYAEGYTHARLSAPAMRALSEWVRENRLGEKPSAGLKLVMLAAGDHLEGAAPRVVKRSEAPPVIVFVDGACEEDSGVSIGGVLLDGDRGECLELSSRHASSTSGSRASSSGRS